jgi:VanZ family protein
MHEPLPPVVDRRERLAARARTLAVLYFLALFAATHIPMPPDSTIEGSDKLCHLVGYALLTLGVLVGWELTIGVLKPKHYFAVWLVGTLYGAFDELTQIPVGRDCDINDWATDVLGIVVGLLAFRLVRRGLAWWLARGDGLSMGKL